ncbi:MAG: adenosylmethionine decarboxylase [Verrucomicrobiota bacterium]
MNTPIPMTSGPAGQHLVLELNGCNPEVLDDRNAVERGLRSAASLIQVAVVECKLHQFSPQGVTGAILLDSAHLTIHTWPEYSYAAIDCYACSEGNLNLVSTALSKAFEPQNQNSIVIERGLVNSGLSRVKDHVPVDSVELDFAQSNIPKILKIDHSPGRGFGLFTRCSFEENEVLYEAPGHLLHWLTEIVISTDVGASIHTADDYCYEILPPFVETWPSSMRDNIAKHYQLEDDSPEGLLEAITEDGKFEVMITGLNGMQNHSQTPNTILDFDTARISFNEKGRPFWTIPVRALRSIEVGEELFADYGNALPDFVVEKNWLT